MLSYHDQKHLTRLFVQEQRVSTLFSALINKVSPELRKWRDNNQNASVWVRNQAIEKLIDLRLNEFQAEFKKLIDSGVLNSWEANNEKNDKLVRDYIQALSLKQVVVDGFFNRNLEALNAFQKRVDNGFTLSDRVFQTAQNTKQQLEFYLKSGIGTGQSADQISRDIRQLLQDPDKRFRRVRNDAGKLVPSQPMKDFHPGQGVYRSAYKNAVRLAATETNMSYRLADASRWQQLDFVLGFEVKRSRNAEPCVICDALVGKYPKSFIFPGWHPFCICVATPILMTQENSAKYFLAKYSKKYGAQYKPDYVTEIPIAAQNFIDNNPGFAQNSYAGKFNFQHNESGLLRSKSIAVGEAIRLLNQKKQTTSLTNKTANKTANTLN
jgi:hypothetical protein